MLDVRERSALQRLAKQELAGLYSLARRLGGVDPEELVQEALLGACRSYATLRDPQAGCKWLRTILTNVWRDRLRRDGRLPDEIPVEEEESFSLYRTLAEEDPFPYSDTLHVDFLGSFSEHDVHLVLGRLPAMYRAPLVLRYIEGFQIAGVAEALELPEGTVMSQIHRGRQRFERALWAYAEESGMVEPTTTSPAAQGGGGR